MSVYWDIYWTVEWLKERFLVPNAPKESIRGSERAVLIESIAAEYPFESLLEVGCAFGQNLTILAKRYPKLSITAIDRKPEVLEQAAEVLRRRRIENVDLRRALVQDLSQFPDNSFDIVVSSAMLLFVSSDDIEQAISEMLRVAKSKVVILEQHQEDPRRENQHLGIFVPRRLGEGGYWLRDYRKLFENFVKPEQIKLLKVPNPRWQIEQWKQLAHVIVCEVE